LYRRCFELLANGFVDRYAGFAVIAKDAHLDQAVGIQAEIDFLGDGWCQATFADNDDRTQAMGFGAQFAALGGGKFLHRLCVPGTRLNTAWGLFQALPLSLNI